MPERDYSKGQIYTIRCRDDPELIYVGSTINTLSKRLGQHKSYSKAHPEQLVYKTIAGNWDQFYVELYELYPCGSKNELLRREGEITREIGTMNNNIAGRTQKEHYTDNREAEAERYKAYRLRNAEDIAERMKAYRQQNTEALAEKRRQKYQQYAEVLKEKSLQRYHKNKEKAHEYSRQYRQQNTEAINEKRRQRYHKKKAEAQAQ